MVAIKFAKLNEYAIIPNKKDEDAGLDIFAYSDSDIVIHPNETVKIPTGICSAFDPEWVAIIKERSSMGSKGLGVRAGVIDSSYRGEWLVCMTNHTKYEYILYNDRKPPYTVYDKNNNVVNEHIDTRTTKYIPMSKAIAQCIMVKVPDYDIEEWTPNEVKAVKSERGDRGFGSTDKFFRNLP
jgi:dUTP pyrophosphatase